MKKQEVVKLLSARQRTLRQQPMEHISTRVDAAYPPEKSQPNLERYQKVFVLKLWKPKTRNQRHYGRN
eukprot:3912505-Karenia_brevis.AAC.1